MTTLASNAGAAERAIAVSENCQANTVPKPSAAEARAAYFNAIKSVCVSEKQQAQRMKTNRGCYDLCGTIRWRKLKATDMALQPRHGA